MIGVGGYVRTQKGIFKILGIKTVQTKMNGNHVLAYLIDDCPLMYITDNNFIKHSKNIIDLIEVGDYVNGLRVEYITNEAIFTSGLAHGILFEDIRTIVTKEQIASIEYKVEEE